MASIHAEVASDMKLSASHDIIERAEKELSHNLNIELVIHTDPIEINDPRIQKFSSIVKNYLANKSKELDAHDFRLVDGKSYINFIFDLVVPFGYTKVQMEDLKMDLEKVLQSYNDKIICIINFENGYN